MEFSDWLLSELAKRKWTQADLARRSGLTKQAVTNYVSGRVPNRDALVSIAKSLQIPIEIIFDAVSGKNKSEKTLQISKFDHIIEQLPDEDIDDLYTLAKAKLERIEEKSRQAASKKKHIATSTPKG